jgi:hypothetical protein
MPMQERPEVHRRHARRQVDEHLLLVFPAIDPDRELVGEQPKRLPRPRPEHQVRKVPRLERGGKARLEVARLSARWRAIRSGPSSTASRIISRSIRRPVGAVAGSGCGPRRVGRAVCCGVKQPAAMPAPG